MTERVARTEGYPSLTAREHWGRYATGVGVEVAFILTLTAVGFLLALIATVIWL